MQARIRASRYWHVVSAHCLRLVVLCFFSSEIHATKAHPHFLHHRLLSSIEKSLSDFSIKKTSQKIKTKIIVIDAGHGGKDPGAIGKSGAKEKEIVLEIAKSLANKINRTPHMRAILTRDGDVYLPLRRRMMIARMHRADLLIAIHADAYFGKSAEGASVYALSSRGATSEAGRWLAERENYAEMGSIDFNALSDQSLMLRSVLIDLAQTKTIQESVGVGQKVLNAIDDFSHLHRSRVEQAPFMVLKSPDVPSILIETGFITSPSEEKKLMNPRYQDRLAEAICRGVKQYYFNR